MVARLKAANWRELFASIVEHRKLLLYLVILMAAFNLSSHGTQDLYPTFLKQDHGLDKSPNAVGWITAISQIGAIIGGLTFGFLSDRKGRRRAIRWAFCGAVFCLPLWAFAPHGNLPLLALGGFMIQFMVQGAWGVVPAHLTELAPDNVRGFAGLWLSMRGTDRRSFALRAGIISENTFPRLGHERHMSRCIYFWRRDCLSWKRAQRHPFWGKPNVDSGECPYNLVALF